jgi:DeoR/GlpR family transcriptional regulator of sugar metabolism
MMGNKRREKILELIREDGSAKVIKLAKIFKVSEVTIRQDLEKLEQEGFILREHGGAFLKNVEEGVKSITLLNQENIEKKQKIGKKASELIENGDAIILDSGSTTTEIAKNLLGRKALRLLQMPLI